MKNKMTIGEWIIKRSSSESEKQAALTSAGNFLDEEVIGNEGESNNTPVAQFCGGEVVLAGRDSRCYLRD